MKHYLFFLFIIVFTGCGKNQQKANNNNILKSIDSVSTNYFTYKRDTTSIHHIDSITDYKSVILYDTIFQHFMDFDDYKVYQNIDTSIQLESDKKLLISFQGHPANDSFGIKYLGHDYFKPVVFHISLKDSSNTLFEYTVNNRPLRSIIGDYSFSRHGAFLPKFIKYLKESDLFIFSQTLYWPESDAPKLNWFFALNRMGELIFYDIGDENTIRYNFNKKLLLTPLALYNFNGKPLRMFNHSWFTNFLNDSTYCVVKYLDSKDTNVFIHTINDSLLFSTYFDCYYIELMIDVNVSYIDSLGIVGLYNIKKDQLLIIYDSQPVKIEYIYRNNIKENKKYDAYSMFKLTFYLPEEGELNIYFNNEKQIICSHIKKY